MGLYLGENLIGKVLVGTQESGSGSVTLQSKSATPSETAQTITADSGYDGLSSVEVGAISSTYVGSGITSRSSSDLTASGATVTAPAGYYSAAATKSITSGSATTPATTITANPSISVNSSSGLITATTSTTQNVTPTVSAGYVSSGTAGTIAVSGSNTEQLTTQAAQTISPSTSDQTIASGRYLIGAQTIEAVALVNLIAANIADGVTVKVGSATDDDCIASVTGTYTGSGSTASGLTYETGTYSPTSDIARPTISFSDSHSNPPILIMMSDTTNTSDTTTNSNYTFAYVDDYRMWGTGVPYSSSAMRYGVAYYTYRGTSTSSISCSGTPFSYSSGNSSSSSYSYARYWATESNFKPYSRSTSRYWRSGRTYQWIAVWAPES